MLIEGTSVRHFGAIPEAKDLTKAVKSLPDETWFQDKTRQEVFSNVHSQTQTIILMFCAGWPDVNVERRSGWDILGAHAIPVMKSILSKHFANGGIVIRAMVAKLIAGGKIDRHYDAHPSFAAAHRIHVPLVTSSEVDFFIGDEKHSLKAGHGYEINNLLYHEVHNRSARDRIHFIFDYAPADQLEGR